MKYEVYLKLHEDEHRRWGVCPSDSVGTFDAFWTPDGIFHDVFEHWFEGQVPYFSGRYAHTMFGEMAASGAALAFASIGINNFRYRHRPDRDYCADTQILLEDFVHGHQEDPDFCIKRSNCIVPYQKQPNDITYRYWLNEYENWYLSHIAHERFKVKALNFSCVKNCYAWGFKLGKKLIRDAAHSYEVLDNFLEHWHHITRAMDPQYLGISPEGDDEPWEVQGFRFYVNTSPKLLVKTVIVDGRKEEYPIERLSSF